jgi:hypothetical protein
MTKAKAKEQFLESSGKLIEAEIRYEQRLRFVRIFQESIVKQLCDGISPSPEDIAITLMGDDALRSDLTAAKEYDRAAEALKAVLVPPSSTTLKA